MAVYRGKAGMVGIFLGTMPSYGADPGGATHQLWCDIADSTQAAVLASDANMANGYEEMTTVTTLQEANGVPPISCNVSDVAFPALVGLALGTDSRTDTGSAYRLNQVAAAIGIELPNTAIQFNPGASADAAEPESLYHLGCVVNSLTLSGSVGSPWKLSANMFSSGKFGTPTSIVSAVTSPSLVIYPFERSYLFAGADGTMTPTTVEDSNAVPTGTCLSAPEDWGGSLESFSWTINNSIDEATSRTANGLTYASSAPRANRTQTLNMSFKWPSTVTNIKQLRKNIGYIQAFQLQCRTNSQIGSTGYYYGFCLKWPRACLTSATLSGGLGPKTIDTTWTVMQPTATYSSVYGHSWSTQIAATASGLIN